MVFGGHCLDWCWEIPAFLDKSGVALFFVLSSYLLTESYCYKKKTVISWNWIKEFYKKRILRVYPPLIVVLIMFVIMGTVSIRDAIFALFMCKDVIHLWFLRYLLLFYFLFPFILFLMSILKKFFFVLLSCGWLGIVGYLIICSAKGKSAHFVLYIVACFLIGMILPVVLHRIETHAKNLLNKSCMDVYMIVLFICFQILGFVWCKGMGGCASENVKWYLNNFYDFMRVIGASLVTSGMIVTFRECHIIKSIAPRCKLLMCIGKYSYSIYLVHCFVIIFICGWGAVIGGRELGTLYFLAIVLMTGMLSHILYTYVERKFESR